LADESCGRLNCQFHPTLYSRANRRRSMSIIQAPDKNRDRYMRLRLFQTRDCEQV